MKEIYKNTILKPPFFQCPTERVARELLGKLLVSSLYKGRVVVRIVETEAYGDQNDAASHAASGKKKRNDAMFGSVGHTYVYRSYGIHLCLNVVARDPAVTAGAVLIRAVEPIEGLSIIEQRRGVVDCFNLTNGPGKVGQALALELAHNNISLFSTDSSLILANDPRYECGPVGQSRRIGISKNVTAPWRFYLKGNGWVTPKR